LMRTLCFQILMQGRRPHWSFRGLLNVHAVAACRLAESPCDPSVSKAPTVSFPPRVASIATGWSDPVAGQDSHLLKVEHLYTAHTRPDPVDDPWTEPNGVTYGVPGTQWSYVWCPRNPTRVSETEEGGHVFGGRTIAHVLINSWSAFSRFSMRPLPSSVIVFAYSAVP